jgi:hypothetical protein
MKLPNRHIFWKGNCPESEASLQERSRILWFHTMFVNALKYQAPRLKLRFCVSSNWWLLENPSYKILDSPFSLKESTLQATFVRALP